MRVRVCVCACVRACVRVCVRACVRACVISSLMYVCMCVGVVRRFLLFVLVPITDVSHTTQEHILKRVRG